MHKEGLETYNDLIKIFILLLCVSIRQDREIENYSYWIIITCISITTYTTKISTILQLY